MSKRKLTRKHCAYLVSSKNVVFSQLVSKLTTCPYTPLTNPHLADRLSLSIPYLTLFDGVRRYPPGGSNLSSRCSNRWGPHNLRRDLNPLRANLKAKPKPLGFVVSGGLEMT